MPSALAVCIHLLQAQYGDLNSVFTFDQTTLSAAYEYGKSEAKKGTKAIAFERPWCRDLGTVRSPRHQSWTAPYALLYTASVDAKKQGYNDQRRYNDDSRFKSYVTNLASAPPALQARSIQFFIRLYAWPGLDRHRSVNRSANEDDVKKVQFVLLVDGDKPLHPKVAPEMLSSKDISGTLTAPASHSGFGSATVASSAGIFTATGTTNYTSWEVEGYQAYMADYNVLFPMFDESGRPYVTSKTKTLVLKVIRDNGEHTAIFHLADFGKS